MPAPLARKEQERTDGRADYLFTPTLLAVLTDSARSSIASKCLAWRSENRECAHQSSFQSLPFCSFRSHLFVLVRPSRKWNTFSEKKSIHTRYNINNLLAFIKDRKLQCHYRILPLGLFRFFKQKTLILSHPSGAEHLTTLP